MDLKQFLQVLRRRWRSIVAMVLLALTVSAVITFVVMKTEYESKSRIFISVDVSNATESFSALYFANNRAASYADLAKSSELSQRVIDSLDLQMTAEELSDNISATVIENTSLIEVTVRDSEPRRAQTIADVATDAFTDYIAELESPGGDGADSQVTAQVTDRPSYNPDQVSPMTVINLVAASLIGLVAGVGLAIARELLDRTVRTADHVAEVTDSPVLASIGYDGDLRKSPVLTDLGGFAARTEAFRLLRTNLRFIDLDHQPRCIVISSAVPGEGKTVTSTNLAVALAQTGRRTLIIDADLRRPRVASTLGLDPAVGMTTALVGKTEIDDAIQIHEPSGLHVLASGAKPPNPTEILQSKITQDLIRRLRGSYDIVIIDAPPLLPVADASVLATLADGLIMVIRHGKTTRDQVEEAAHRIERVAGKLYGVVVNMVAKRAVGSYYYYYYEETAPSRDLKRKPKDKAASAEGGEEPTGRRAKKAGKRVST
ncbi:polysaccharide biosynthesis tyrosine autokinase [Nocardioides panacisoli]|uniref:polysaccharide biosynthesis tyrosine autokinase n=1 Tax=Nocardioides panacisoli TaxID=627624 RepID=UPI001C62A550|nr:polysaccharide biosynthesis tyrosine autokinase [Nocardioides panacisoli]QYJ03945.1 polysaccharide biosynthesis tyrosine autokinase [Nocardioides panacisoli]